MQTSNQFPQEPEESNEESAAKQVSQPLYEFPALYTQQGDVSGETGVPSSTSSSALKSASETDEQLRPENDLIRRGLVYPPPPSFYQQAQNAHSQPLPLPPYPAMGGVGMQSFGYSGRQSPPFALVPPKKKSYRWLWITLSIFGVLLLAGCGVCGWAFSQFITPIIQSEMDVINVSNEYYAALQNKDYAGAYQYLLPQESIQGMTQAIFTKRAQSADNQYGTVRSYTTRSINIVTDANDEFNFSRLTVVVNIARTGRSYNVLLTLKKSGNNWKITNFDKI